MLQNRARGSLKGLEVDIRKMMTY